MGLQVRAHMPVSVCELHVHNELQAGPASKWTDYEVGKAGGLCMVLKGSANACLEVCLESTVCVPVDSHLYQTERRKGTLLFVSVLCESCVKVQLKAAFVTFVN